MIVAFCFLTFAYKEFLAGFHELIPLDLIPMFSPAELELLMFYPPSSPDVMTDFVIHCVCSGVGFLMWTVRICAPIQSKAMAEEQFLATNL